MELVFVPRFEGSFSSDSCNLFQLPVSLVFIKIYHLIDFFDPQRLLPGKVII